MPSTIRPTRSRPTSSDRVPLRTCVGCRTTRPATELVRVVLSADGTLTPGRTLAGRGAWLCPGSTTCPDTAARRGGFDRAFKTRVDRSAIDALHQNLVGGAPD
ncbi:MAG: YlxR family protein [Microthrixaceae bacterium]|jgi:predicted RNA-binding protein YlxR (DUF448 family)|nr:YlxR family protein [Microthrixaceae bacterium]